MCPLEPGDLIALYFTLDFTISTNVTRDRRIRRLLTFPHLIWATSKWKEERPLSGGYVSLSLLVCALAHFLPGKLQVPPVLESYESYQWLKTNLGRNKKAKMAVYKDSNVVANMNYYSWNFWQTLKHSFITDSAKICWSKNMLSGRCHM